METPSSTLPALTTTDTPIGTSAPEEVQADEPTSSSDASFSERPCGFAMRPKQIKAYLDQHVVGQDVAKKKLAVAVYNHFHRIDYMRKKPPYGVDLSKSNVLLLGPSGSGKTLLAQTIAQCLHVPFAMADATSLTEAGYMGEDVEHVLVRLFQAAGEDTEKAERGIIFIDEIDKITRKSESPTAGRDVSGEGVQQALLKILEGTVSFIPDKQGRKRPQDEMRPLDTTQILFICGGAFVGLEQVIAKRLASQKHAASVDVAAPEVATPLKADALDDTGAQALVTSLIEKAEATEAEAGNETSSADELLAQLLPEDLIRYGMLPEFVGRLPVIAPLQALDHGALVKVLTEPKNSIIRQYKQVLGFEGVDLQFTPDALDAIAIRALTQGVGARGLRAILEDVMLDVMFEVPSMPELTELTIDADVIEGRRKALVL